MKYKMQTESGSVYTVDTEALTLRRLGAVPIPELDDETKLLNPPFVQIGQRASIWTKGGEMWSTSPVVRLEIVE